MRTIRALCGAALVAAAGVAGVVVLPSTGVAAAADASAGAFTLDSVHSMVVFRINHLGASYTYGRFNEPKGSFTIDDTDPGKSMLHVEVTADSVDTGNEGRDRHLKSPDFFNAKQFPSISFKSSSIKKSSEGKYEAAGELTMLGQAKPLTVTLEKVGSVSGHPKFGTREGYETTFTIKRSDFGMKYGLDGNTLGDDVRITVSIEGMKQ